MTTTLQTDDAGTQASEIGEKRDRLHAALDRLDAEGILLTSRANVAWLLGGADHVVSRVLETGFAWVLVTRERMVALALNNEAARLREELRLEELGFELLLANWWDGSLAALAGSLCPPERLVTDGAGPGRPEQAALTELRLTLTGREIARLRALGDDTRAALEDTIARWPWSGWRTERDAAAAIAAALESRDVMPGGIMVAGAERRARYRHPVVTGAPLGSELLVVAVGIRGGLNVALTRCAALGSVDPEWTARHAVACRVESAMMAASRPGRTWTDALAAGIDAYREAGWPEEWREHTQGGPIGYGPREFNAYPAAARNRLSDLPIAAGQACAWNPTVAGAKSEDTFLVGEAGAESVTSGSGYWPVVDLGETGAPARPAVLQL